MPSERLLFGIRVRVEPYKVNEDLLTDDSHSIGSVELPRTFVTASVKAIATSLKNLAALSLAALPTRSELDTGRVGVQHVLAMPGRSLTLMPPNGPT